LAFFAGNVVEARSMSANHVAASELVRLTTRIAALNDRIVESPVRKCF
jgi:hypothetical protein